MTLSLLFISFIQVNQLVEEETRRYRPTKNYLDFLPTPDYDAFEVKSLFL